MAEAFEIYSDFYDIEPGDSVGIIRLYEQNKILLDNKSTFKDKEDFNDYVLLSAQYVISLEKMGKYSKSVQYADKILELIDLRKDEFDINQKDFTTYWSIMTTKGRAFFYLKDYNCSILIFKKLLEWDLENDYFKLWLDESKSKKRNLINNYLYIIAAILIIAELFFGSQIENPKIRLYNY